MTGAFRRSFAVSREALAETLSTRPRFGLSTPEPTEVAEGLWSVSRLLESNTALRRGVADASRSGDDRAGLVDRLLKGKISEGAHRVVETVVRQRWPAASDVPRALEYLAVEALLVHARAKSRLAQVEDELFRFERVVAGNDELRAALIDPRAGAAAKAALVERLLGHRAAPETVRLVSQAVTSPRSRRFDRAIEGYLSIAEVMQQQLTATVSSAISLDEAQVQRLTDALSAQYGRRVNAHVVVDPAVIGGLRVEIADEVIDGTIRRRLDEARRRLTG